MCQLACGLGNSKCQHILAATPCVASGQVPSGSIWAQYRSHRALSDILGIFTNEIIFSIFTYFWQSVTSSEKYLKYFSLWLDATQNAAFHRGVVHSPRAGKLGQYF